MVLHHVAHGAVFVIIGPAFANALRLRDGNLHVVDGEIVPQGFEQTVGEPQGDQVLHRLLAEIVIDAEYSIFVERGSDRVIDDTRTRQVFADGLFHRHPRMIARQSGSQQALANGAIEARRHRQIVERTLDPEFGHLLTEAAYVLRFGCVHG